MVDGWMMEYVHIKINIECFVRVVGIVVVFIFTVGDTGTFGHFDECANHVNWLWICKA